MAKGNSIPKSANKKISKTIINKEKNRDEPIKIIIEVVVRNETSAKINSNFLKSEVDKLLPSTSLEATEEPNFGYSFTLQRCSILQFVIEGQNIPIPPDSGSLFVNILDPDTPQKVRMRVVAIQDLPNPVATLTLKFNGKTVTTPSLVFNGGKAGFDKLIKLPQ